ncbi:hypothetical protein GCM10017612_39810 [Novosphingobium resinovorum]|nr:hypothetical protein GCM10017612_39810 [Novosphingobium resinovorum]
MRNILSFDVKARFHPSPRQQFIDPVDRVALANAVKHISKPFLRIGAIEFGRLQKRKHGSGALTATIGTGKEPVFAADGNA